MDNKMDYFSRESVDVGDGYEYKPHPVAVAITDEPTPSGVGTPEEKLMEERLIHPAYGEQRWIMQTNFIKGLLSFSWLIHVIAVGCTVAAVRLSFSSTYWADEADWNSRFLWSLLRGTRVQDLLQFGAKLYEIIIVTSMSAMVMHFLRRMLVGDGVPFGLMSGAYQVGAPLYLFSRSLWSPFRRPGSRSNFLFAFSLAFLVLYANVIGPFTAIILTPLLEWWPMHDPYDGEKLTTYIRASPEFLYPSLLTGSAFVDEDGVEGCMEFAKANCPDSGIEDVKDLIDAWAQSNAQPSVEIKHSGAETLRDLVSSLQYSTENEHLAIATTLHSSIVELAGTFWNYVHSADIGQVNDAKRPRFKPERDDIYAPLVQVQCSGFSHNEFRESDGETPTFHMGRMRNFSSYHHGQPDSYRDRDKVAVPADIWDVDRSDDLWRSTFDWVDVEPLFDTDRPSLAALVTVPVIQEIRTSNGTINRVQDSLFVPCMIDARWAGSKTAYDPTADRTMPNNLTDLNRLAPYYGRGGNFRRMYGNLNQANMYISPSWAKHLNLETGNVSSSTYRKFNGNGMNWLLDSFVFEDDRDNELLSFKTSNYSLEAPAAEAHREAARAVATVLSLAVTEGVSRAALTYNLGLVRREYDDGNLLWKGLWLQSSDRVRDLFNTTYEEYDLAWATPINWKVDRRGYGYGFRTPTIVAGVILMLFHSALVVVFAVYVFCFRITSRGWASNAWSEFGELIALGVASRVPANQGLLRDIAAGEKKWTTMREKVHIRTVDGAATQLVVGHPHDSFRLNPGRTYS
ncbi:hypothetical protein S40288_10714 [Stachybotrys chartarum IBT 40288]|nr:hypothetical protein S40288_10714 [Stachybotrys chartarum IBT 40288]